MRTLSLFTLVAGYALGGLMAAGTVSAQTTPLRWTVSVGGLSVQPHSSVGALEGGPATPSPASAKVEDARTVFFSARYQATPQISLEFVLGVPPKHKITGEGFIAPFGQIASVKQLAPTAFANWHFDELMPHMHPFVGLGINHTQFSNGRTTASGNLATGGPTTLKFKDSWGLALHAGLSYEIDANWSVRGSVGTTQVDTVATFSSTTPNGVVTRRAEVDFKPVVLGLSLGYAF